MEARRRDAQNPRDTVDEFRVETLPSVREAVNPHAIRPEATRQLRLIELKLRHPEIQPARDDGPSHFVVEVRRDFVDEGLVEFVEVVHRNVRPCSHLFVRVSLGVSSYRLLRVTRQARLLTGDRVRLNCNIKSV